MPTWNILPKDDDRATLVGRAWRPEVNGPSIIAIRERLVFDITSAAAPTVSDLLELENVVEFVRTAEGQPLGTLQALMDTTKQRSTDRSTLLAPCDLQAIKACGVTFAGSMVERVTEEQAQGGPARAREVRRRVMHLIGNDLAGVTPVPGAAPARACTQAEMAFLDILVEVAVIAVEKTL